MSPSQIFFFSLLAFLFGVFFSSFNLPFYFSLFLFSLLFLFSKEKKLFLFLIFFLFLFGYLKYEKEFFKLEKEKEILLKKEAVLATLILPPREEEKYQELILKPKDFEGKILVRTFKSLKFEYGDLIFISGKFKRAKENFLKDKILAISYFPKIERKNKNSSSFIFKFVFNFKKKIKKNLETIFPSSKSSFLISLLFGEEEKMPKDFLNKLNITVTRHIVAVSGMNITLISLFVLNFLLTLGLWRHHAFYLTSFFIFLYILAIGFLPSGVRAAIMAFLFLLAQQFGRLASAQRTIFLAVVIMLFFNPFLLKYDLFFQISFLATLGLIYLYPVFLEFFKDLPNFLDLRKNICATLSAQIFVLPLILYNFGDFSLSFLFPNILILPILPLLTILTFFVSLLAFFSFSLAKFFSFSVLFFLNYIFEVINFFSKFPPLFFPQLSFSFLVFSYFFIFLFAFLLHKKFGSPFFLR